MTANTIRRIEKISQLINAKSYLEIGVNEGATFNNLSFKKKVGVDPDFLFDTAKYESPNIHFINETSDEFFQSEASQTKFDIIFIDGLHTYEQTFADISNCLRVTKNKTFLLIDDMIPIDFFSTLRDQSFAKKCRRFPHGASTSIPGAKSWHGDTFKLIYFLNLFLTSYDYCTIDDSGNGQTLVWHQSLTSNKIKKPFKRFTNRNFTRNLCENFHTIDYFKAFSDHSDIFQFCGELELFNYLQDSIDKEAIS